MKSRNIIIKLLCLLLFVGYNSVAFAGNPIIGILKKVDVSCYNSKDGSVQLKVTDGLPPFKFKKDNGTYTTSDLFNSLKAGNYKFYVKDSLSKVDSISVTVSNVNPISTAATLTIPTCNYTKDGNIAIAISGGNGGYSYSWSNSAINYQASTKDISNIGNGTYKLSVIDVKGCTLDTQFVLNSVNYTGLSIKKSDITCYNLSNGQAKLNFTGTGTSYTINWTGPNSFSSIATNIVNLAKGYYEVSVKDNNGCTATANTVIVMPSELVALIKTTKPALCKSGSSGAIYSDATGGIKPYSYSWSGPSAYSATGKDIFSLPAGTYLLTVSDSNGCTASNSSTVTEPTQLNVTGKITDVTCYGLSNGKVEQTVNGATPPYYYSWSNSAKTKDILNVVAAGYQVTVTDSNGCAVTKSYTVSSPQQLQLTYLSSPVKCNGQSNGTITLFATGGTFPWTYKLSKSGFLSSQVSNKNLYPGVYAAKLTDANGCGDSTKITITEPLALSTVKKAVQPACYGLKGSLSLSVSGGTSPYSYEWLDASNSLYAATQNVVSADVGSYTYTVTDANQCTKSDTILIYQPTKLKISLKSFVNPVCINDSTGQLKFSARGGIKPYQFQLNGKPFQSDSSYTKLFKGLYSVSVKDKNACTDTLTTNLKFVDTVKPVIRLRSPKIYLNAAGNTTLALSLLDSGIFDNCELASVTISKTNFSCLEKGVNTVSVTATDLTGNSKSGTTKVTVLDTISPVIVSQTANIYLNNAGAASLSASALNKASYDNCKIDSVLISKSSFNCSNLGVNSIILTIKDNSGNTVKQKVNVNVLDTIKPTLNYRNINCFLNSSGSGSITVSQIDNSSSDNCGIVSYALSQQTFDCSNIGTNFVNFTITDKTGNFTVQSVKVTVIDTFKPVIKSKPVSIYVNQFGYVVLSPSDIDNGSYDNCKISTKTISKSVFNCTDVGNNSILYTLTDPSGNTVSTYVAVKVLDTIVPINKTRSASVYLNKNGVAQLGIFDVDNGSSDNCNISTYSLNKDRFYCNELGSNTINFKTVDPSGNTTISPIKITVLDTIKPIIKVVNRDVFLDKNGQFSITPAYFDDGSYDNCGIKTKVLSQSSFNCSDIGNHIILYTIYDTSGNSSIALVNIKVQDTLSPILNVSNKTVYLDSNGYFKLPASNFNSISSDNCGIKQLYLSDSVFTCSQLGDNLVKLYGVDYAGNITAKSFFVKVVDTISPTFTTKNVVIFLDTVGNANLTYSQVVAQAYDNCKIQNYILSKSQFSEKDLGDNIIDVWIRDAAGNRSKAKQTKVVVIYGDADKDSIPDLAERGLDFDGDGVPNYLDKDSDNDGILDVLENEGKRTILDQDRDGYANIYDYDTDNDKILDVVEVNGYDPDRNGRVGFGKVTVSSLGIPVLANVSLGYVLINTDNDTIPDYKDLDSDNDLISDRDEFGSGNQAADFDGDGILDFRDTDSDNDQISDLIETNFDFDEDGKPNRIDIDSDNDNIVDLMETNNDFDSDGIGNWLDLDSDADGILDINEGALDTDGDGKGNWIDNDADNDGIPDNVETNLDFDGDQVPDYLDFDSDNDKIKDEIEGIPFKFGSPADTDVDGQFDFRDEDSDGDGISDAIEGYPNIPDTDHDGTPDYRDLDSDGDGTPDAMEGLKDTDGDGTIDAVDSDSDGDGIPDIIETNADSDGDGVPNCLDLDADNDGINDCRECRYNDLTGTGMVKFLDSCITRDIDGDGIFNFLDTDSDGDGISDLLESGQTLPDMNFDGRIDGVDTDGDGIQDDADGYSGQFGDKYDLDVLNTDGDTLRDFEDFDSDNDNIPDKIETSVDNDQDLLGNWLDLDSDNDKILDKIETNADADFDGIGNWLDFDSDNDGIVDSTELDNDFDGDGIMNFLDLDSDNDEMLDQAEGDRDVDANTFKDFVDPQSFVPEVFTPNFDGVNDSLHIKGLNNYPDASLTVYNQWGQVVYRSNGPYQNNWTGENREGNNFERNRVLPEGIYFFILDHNRSDKPAYTKPQSKGNFYIKP